MLTWRRAFSLGAVVAVILLSGVAGGAWWWTGRVTPPLSGQERLAGLRVPVQIEFDRYGIPHVYARTTDDLWAAIGYLHGRERLWQMELYRRASAGRLSELLGEQLLPVDRRFRRLGLTRAAEAELARLTPRVREALERYAHGVNAARQAAGRWGLPVEFLALRTQPQKWDPVDSLAIGKLMAWRLGENHRAELVRYALDGKFTRADVAELMGTPPAWAPVIAAVADGASRASGAGGASGASRASGESFPAALNQPFERSGWVLPHPPHAPHSPYSPYSPSASASQAGFPGGLLWLGGGGRALSNSWVVAGSRTATGRPLLANDPHLGVEMPAIWYEAHLVAADIDVTGVTIPGIPFVVIGHNRRIGWGVTSVGADVQDFYIERIDAKRRQYLNRGAWVPLKIERHDIPVRGRGPERFDVLLTERGPVANAEEWDEPPPAEVSQAVLSDRPLSLRWDVITHGDTHGAFEALGRAASWEEFLAAVRGLGSSAQNFVYADVDGNIGYAMSGLVPRRTSHDGSAPTPGWTDSNDWRGYVDSQELPALLNPSSGVLITANNEVDRRFPHVITRDWVAPFRAIRVGQLLEGQTGLDVKVFQKMQGDQISAAAALILPAVESAAAAARRGKLSRSTLAALDRLRLWDRTVDHRPVVSLYETFLAALWRRTFVDELGGQTFQRFYEWAARERYAGLYMIVGDPASHWWDDLATIDRKESRDDIVALAAEDAILMLNRRFEQESAWPWDRLHAVKFTHSLASGGKVLDWFFSRGPVPIAGDTDTINRTTVDLREPYLTTELASSRQILDVGAWDNSLGVITTGQSGHPRSLHYFDQNLLWREGRHHPLPYSRQAVVNARVSQLLLIP